MNKKSLSRRDFLRAAAIGSSGMALASTHLGALANSVPSYAQRAALTYFDVDESGSGEPGFAVYKQLTEMFMDSNPDVDVQFQPALPGWHDTLVTDIAAGVGPDIFPHYSDFGRTLMENGQMLPLNDFISPEELEDFYEQQIIAVKIDETLYALPKYVSSIAMAYNKTMLDEAGIPYPGDDLNWDTFFAAVSSAAQLGPNESGRRFGYYNNKNYSEHWIWQNGGEWMNAPVLGTKILIDEPPAFEALKRLHDLIFVEGSASTFQDTEGLEWPQIFQTGRFAFVEGHSWQVSEWLRTIEFDWDYTLLPAGSAGHIGTVFNDSYSVWEGTANPDVAVAFLKFISSPEIKEMMMLSIHGWQPPLRSLEEAWNTNSAGAKAGKNVTAFSESTRVSRQQPYFIQNQRVSEIVSPLWEMIWDTGELGLEDGVEQIVTGVNSFLGSI